ncbi:MAG: aspartate aminotransferase family protein [Rhodospirillaceae bacterium]|nr:aspartate aminotransferase family protein [Rhodospirillaceae bacterium]|tara:strand:- start:6640 stop:7950 length:1311 start_codon:yes stop_codon:yes gene_type:complete
MTAILVNADLESSYIEAEENFIQRNPKSAAMHSKAAEVMPGGNTRTVLHYAPYPLTFAKGEGAYLYDADGHKLVDFLGEYTAGIYGHDNPIIQAAIETAVRDGIVLGGPNLMEARLAQVIVDRFPALDLVRFTNSGTEANLMAIGAARAFTGRSQVMAMQGGYHGGVLYFASPSPINAPYDITLIPYNDPEAARDSIKRIADDLACIIVEPMMGSSGCIPATTEFLETLREATQEVGALLIFDEVMTSRLAPGGRHGELDILPDLITLGKYLGGGVSFGGFGGRADIMEGFNPKSKGAWPHAGTFNNNIMTMTAGLAGLTQLFTPEACKVLNEKGDVFRKRLTNCVEKRSLPIQVTGIGSMSNVHFTDKPVLRPIIDPVASRKRDLMHLDMLNGGVYHARRCMMNLSLPMTDADLDFAIQTFEEFLDSRHAILKMG